MDVAGERAGGAEFSAPWEREGWSAGGVAGLPLSLALPASLPFSIVRLERLQEMPGQFWGLFPSWERHGLPSLVVMATRWLLLLLQMVRGIRRGVLVRSALPRPGPRPLRSSSPSSWPVRLSQVTLDSPS